MCYCAAIQPQHEDYSFVERITRSLSTAFVQLCAQGAVRSALLRDLPFAADYPFTRSTVDFQ